MGRGGKKRKRRTAISALSDEFAIPLSYTSMVLDGAGMLGNLPYGVCASELDELDLGAAGDEEEAAPSSRSLVDRLVEHGFGMAHADDNEVTERRKAKCRKRILQGLGISKVTTWAFSRGLDGIEVDNLATSAPELFLATVILSAYEAGQEDKKAWETVKGLLETQDPYFMTRSADFLNALALAETDDTEAGRRIPTPASRFLALFAEILPDVRAEIIGRKQGRRGAGSWKQQAIVLLELSSLILTEVQWELEEIKLLGEDEGTKISAARDRIARSLGILSMALSTGDDYCGGGAGTSVSTDTCLPLLRMKLDVMEDTPLFTAGKREKVIFDLIHVLMEIERSGLLVQKWSQGKEDELVNYVRSLTVAAFNELGNLYAEEDKRIEKLRRKLRNASTSQGTSSLDDPADLEQRIDDAFVDQAMDFAIRLGDEKAIAAILTQAERLRYNPLAEVKSTVFLRCDPYLFSATPLRYPNDEKERGRKTVGEAVLDWITRNCLAHSSLAQIERAKDALTLLVTSLDKLTSWENGSGIYFDGREEYEERIAKLADFFERHTARSPSYNVSLRHDNERRRWGYNGLYYLVTGPGKEALGQERLEQMALKVHQTISGAYRFSEYDDGGLLVFAIIEYAKAVASYLPTEKRREFIREFRRLAQDYKGLSDTILQYADELVSNGFLDGVDRGDDENTEEDADGA